MYLISSPISNETVTLLKEYTEDLGINVKIIRVYIDLQNIAIGKFYTENVSNIYNNMTEQDVVSLLVYELSKFVSDKINKFRDVFKINEVYFYLYSDESRNKLNEYFIPGWKQNRRKAWEYLQESDVKMYEAQSWLSGVSKSGFKISAKILNTSPHCFITMLKYVDSDFVPYFFILYDKLNNIDSLHFIVSNDHDYIHVISEFENVFRYFFLAQSKKFQTIDHTYSVYKRIRKKFPHKSLSDDDIKYLTKLYPVFHALFGDPGDGFTNLIPRKPIKQWIKLVQESFGSDYISLTMDYVRSELIKKKCLDLEDELYTKFLNRLFVVDFRYFSEYLYNMLFGIKSEISDFFDKQLSLETKEIFKINTEILKQDVVEKSITSKGEITEILKKFVSKQLQYITDSLWY